MLNLRWIEGWSFPIMGDEKEEENTIIPWWLAEIAYKEYKKRFGDSQTLACIAERGGFGRKELLLLLRREHIDIHM